MKISDEHYQVIRDEISKIANKDRTHIEEYRSSLLANPKVEDAAKRFRWDLLYATGLSKWLRDVIYPYANDMHIDTALRSVMNDLGLED